MSAAKRIATQTNISQGIADTKPIERAYIDMILNFFLRLAFQVNDASTTQGTPGELAVKDMCCTFENGLEARRLAAISRLKIWLFSYLNTLWRLVPWTFHSQILKIFTRLLKLVTLLLGIMKREHILASFKALQRSLGTCIASSNTKFIR